MKKVIIVLLLIAIFIGALSAFYLLNKPSKEMSEEEKEAAIAKILGRKPNLTDDTPKGDIQYNGKYIYFKYPKAAIKQKQLLNGKEVPYTGLEQLILKIENPKLSLYMEVIEAPTNVKSLTDYPSVKLRQIESGYEEYEVYIENTKGLSFEKQSSTKFEKTGFFLTQNRIYSFSIQGPDSKAVQELFESIISSSRFL